MLRLIEDKFRQLDAKFTQWVDQKFKLTEKEEAFYSSYKSSEIADADEYLRRIKLIKWYKYPSAFGSREITRDLKRLLSDDFEDAIDAVYNLHGSLCHQHVKLYPASLPAYDFLMMAFKNIDSHIIDFSADLSETEEFLASILFLFNGLAYCLSDKFCAKYNRKRVKWKDVLRRNLIDDQLCFARYRSHPNVEVSGWANEIIEYLN